MSFDKFKSVKPTRADITSSDSEYIKSVAALADPKPKKSILPIIGTVAAAVLVIVGVTTWALIGRGVRGHKPKDDPVVIQPADTDEAPDDKPERPDNADETNTAPDTSHDENTFTDKNEQTPTEDTEQTPTEDTEQTPTEDTEQTPQNDEIVMPDFSSITPPDDIAFAAKVYGSNHSELNAYYAFKNATLATIIANITYDTDDYKWTEDHIIKLLYAGETYTCVLEADRPYISKNNKACYIDKKTAETIESIISNQKPGGSFITIENCPSPLESNYYHFDNGDSKELLNILGSFEYSEPACTCQKRYHIASGYNLHNTNHEGYRLVIDEGYDNAHVLKDDNKHTLTTEERDKILRLLKNNLIGFNKLNVLVNQEVFYYSKESSITKDGKTLALEGMDDEHFTSLALMESYGLKPCDCGKTYATFDFDGVAYSICKCDTPKITGPCGSTLLENADYWFERIDSLFK